MNIFELTFWEELFIASILFILLLPIALLFSVVFFVVKSSIKNKKSYFMLFRFIEQFSQKRVGCYGAKVTIVL